MKLTEEQIQALVGPQLHTLADALEGAGPQIGAGPSLCAGWSVAHVVAHMSMAARYDPAAFYAELASAGNDFDVLSNRIAARDAALPLPALLGDLRSGVMAGWAPPGGGATGALTHAVIHGLDITTANAMPRTATDTATVLVLDALTASASNHFGTDIEALALQASDLDWQHGHGTPIRASAADLVLALAGRSRPGVNLNQA